MNIIKHVLDRMQGKAIKGQKRSPGWRRARNKYKKKNPRCMVCGSKKKVEIHHIVPFHYAPDLELDERNFASLCENKKYGINCHLLIGHLGNYKKFNINCETDIFIWNNKLCTPSSKL